jgi:DNA-binding GntR family transcriptional regulator
MGGQFAMGERLTETQLAGDLEMSRAPVREALQRLGKEGLVVEHPHHGTFVTEMTAKDVVDFYNVRIGLETTAVRLFMLRGASTRFLRQKVAAMTAAAERDELKAVVAAELAFHRLICEHSGNALLGNLFSQLEGRLSLVMGLDDQGFANLHDVAEEHDPLIEAIEGGDVAVAIQAMEDHVLSTVGDLVVRLGGDPNDLLAPLRLRRSTRRG